MGERKADVLGDKKSLLDTLRKRRQQEEESLGDIPEPVPNADDRRGYTKESWDDNNRKG